MSKVITLLGSTGSIGTQSLDVCRMHGGILDRFDSVMFIAPFVSIAVRYFFYLL